MNPLNIYLEQGGSNYGTSTFNGYQAGLYKDDFGEMDWDYYLIPVGDRVLQLGYQSSDLTTDEHLGMAPLRHARLS